MKTKNKIFIGIMTVAACVFVAACSGGGSGTSLSSYAATLAEDMVLASPTAQTAGARFVSRGSVHATGNPSGDDSASEKKDKLDDLLVASPTSCNLNLTIMSPTNAQCYGPSVSYTTHPVGAGSSSWPGGDLGIWETTNSATSEACSAAQLNSRMQGVSSYIDLGTFVAAGPAGYSSKVSPREDRFAHSHD